MRPGILTGYEPCVACSNSGSAKGSSFHSRSARGVKYFAFRVQGSGSRVSGFGIRDSGFGIRVLGFGFRVSCFVLRNSGFKAGCERRDCWRFFLRCQEMVNSRIRQGIVPAQARNPNTFMFEPKHLGCGSAILIVWVEVLSVSEITGWFHKRCLCTDFHVDQFSIG